MKHPILLTLALAATTTFAAAQMRPGGALGPQQQPGTPPGQNVPNMGGEPGVGGSNQMPGAQQQQQTSTPQVDDATLERELHDQFTRNPSMANVEVQVEKGVVTLQGSVPDKKDKKEAKKLAEKVQGVRKVHEKLTVQPGGAGATSAPSTNPGAAPTNQGATPASTGTPDTTTTPPNTPPTASVGGVSGAAASSGQTATNPAGTGASIGAESAAPGNSAQADTRPWVASDGSTLTTLPDNTSMAGQIKTAFRNDPRLGNNNIDVQVTSDTISLSGNVATGKQKQTARRIADSFAANRKVIDHITVTGQDGNATASPGSPAASSSESGMDPKSGAGLPESTTPPPQ
jgi:osmotically-inducible protein OsmY